MNVLYFLNKIAREKIFRLKGWFFFLLIFLLCVFNLNGTAFSENGWKKALHKSSNAGRIKVSLSDIQQKNAFSRHTVYMKNAAFLMDSTYVPRIKNIEGHILLQLSQPLNPAIREKLKNQGVELLEYIPSNTWKAKISTGAVNKVKAMDFVHAMGDIHPVDKFPKRVLEKDFRSYSYNNDGTVSILVTFHRDIHFDRLSEILTDISGSTEHKEFISGNRAVLKIPQDKLPIFAGFDEVNWIEDRPTPKAINNVNAAALSNIDKLPATPYNLDGTGIVIGEWDGGEVRSDHPDFSGRVTIVDSGSVSTHSTHVSGTMIGSGSGNAAAKGMAPAAILYAYDFYGDVSTEMNSAVSTYNIVLSNNSWGYVLGWENNYYDDDMQVWFGDSGFGQYTSESRAWDQNVINTNLIIVQSAGNDRNDNGDESQSGHHHAGDSTTVYYDYHPPDGDYDCIDPIGISKNIISVGAVTDSGAMISFSSWGPADDGRIKPDIVANGQALTSTCPPSTYCSMSGTSMSAPVVTGAIALIIEHYAAVFGVDPSAAMVKALLINSAIDKGNTGPDYSYGWGMLDARAAVDLISDYLLEDTISNSNIKEYDISVPYSIEDLKVVISWTDPAGTPGAAKALVNDIDIEIVDPSSGIHRPWTLDPDYPSNPAITGINSLDNVEQVIVSSPEEGLWTVRVKGTSIQGSQAFALSLKLPQTCTLSFFSDTYGSVDSQPDYSSSCDFDGDDDIDGSDLAEFVIWSGL